MLLKAEKHLKSIKIIAITAVNGNTTMENVIKNTYRILDGLGRTDVSKFWRKQIFVCEINFEFRRFRFTKVQPKHSFQEI